jgi:hypothetical protein
VTTPILHPAWCHLADCSVTGEPGVGAHVGLARTVTAGDLLISVHLHQGAPLAGYPNSDIVLVLVDLVDTMSPEDPPFSSGWPMLLDEAQELAAVLRSMVAAATPRSPEVPR